MTDKLVAISVKRAARLLGVSPDTVRHYLHQGKLVGAKAGTVWLVTLESVQILIAEREAAAEDRGKEFHQIVEFLADTDRVNRRRRERRRNQG